MSAFFYGCQFVAAECPVVPAHSPRLNVTVVDGDTLHSEEGRRIRFIGINAPELARGDKPGQSLAQEATDVLKGILKDGVVIVQPGPKLKDNYGRELLHIFDSSGRSVEERLILEGLAFHVAMPPNLNFVDCLAEAEEVARNVKRGIWADHHWQAIPANGELRSGFALVRGEVEKIVAARSATYIDLKGQVTLRIAKQDLTYFSQQWWQQIDHRSLLVKGWLVERKNSKPPYKRWVINVGHPAMILHGN